MKRLEDYEYELESTGRRLPANEGLFSIADDGDLTTGYDNAYDGATFTAEERREIADYMIARWQRWAGGPLVIQSDETNVSPDFYIKSFPVQTSTNTDYTITVSSDYTGDFIH